jgi:putative DNA primase/helicase
MVAYLQKLFGICLTGDVSEKILPIIWGPSDTGKTTFSEILLALLGPDYGQEMSEATIAASSRRRSGGEASPDLVRLLGIRLAVVSETSEGMQLNAARVKALTGRNRITARDMYKSQIEFDPTHKIVIETNHKPGMRDGDEAMFRRVHLIPFEVVIPKDEQDPSLPMKLREELAGILAWAVRGCLAWRAEGRLAPPPEIEAATAQYRQESDVLRDFVEDRCVVGPGRSVSVSDLYVAYRAWARLAEDDYPLGKHKFNALVEARGVTREPRIWRGIGIASPTKFEQTTAEVAR